jgi:hypothetical protein
MAPMDNRLLRPRASGLFLPSDADARAYVLAVNAADGQPLEKPVAEAIDAFVIGCKADNIWDAIKASCILAGARTLSGALTPLKGGAPTNVNNNFVSGDYNRETGLVGNGSTKYLNTNRNNNADPQNSKHISLYVTTAVTTGFSEFPSYMGVGANNAGATNLGRQQSNGTLYSRLHRFTFNGNAGAGNSVGLIGLNRSLSTEYVARASNSELTIAAVSQIPFNGSVFVFAENDGGPALYNSGRIAFYSIGESLSLSALDTRVSALINAIGAAI